jgi:uncharacterized membrane protein YccF (DUF307 family)
MSSIGNVLWFIFGGEIVALLWLLIAGVFAITIIGLPIARACIEFAKLSAFPFGKEIIRDTELMDQNKKVTKGAVAVINIILSVIWFPIGLLFTLIYFVLGIISFVTIIGIPVGVAYVRMGKFVMFPIGARVISKMQAQAIATAKEIVKRTANS